MTVGVIIGRAILAEYSADRGLRLLSGSVFYNARSLDGKLALALVRWCGRRINERQNLYAGSYAQCRCAYGQADLSLARPILCPDLSGARDVLDVGCGPGTITVGMAYQVKTGTVWGIHTNDAQIKQAHESAAAQQIRNVSFQVGSCYALPFEDAFFRPGVLSCFARTSRHTSQGVGRVLACLKARRDCRRMQPGLGRTAPGSGDQGLIAHGLRNLVND